MPNTLRFLVAESESPQAREARKQVVGRSNGESYAACLRLIVPDAAIDIVRPAEEGSAAVNLDGFDAVFLSGSPLHLYEDSPDVRRQLAFMRGVFAAGVPSFGSCAGLQVAVVAAGGAVRENRRGHEAAFSRRITPTAAGRAHPMLEGRPDAYDALSIHSDEVSVLPEGAALLATNGVTRVQAAEIRMGPGVFWGVQYHPELPLDELAGALRRQAADLVDQGLVHDEAGVAQYAGRIEALHHEPERRDLAWQLGIDRQVTDPALRNTELRNFVRHLVQPMAAARGR